MKNNKDTVSIFFGDSIVYGLYDKKFGGWVDRIKLYFKKSSNQDFIFNLGIPGQNSYDILNRFEQEIKSRYNKEDNFNIIFSFGIKDALLLNKDKNHLRIFEDNIIKIINKSRKYTNNIFFIGLLKTNINKRKEYTHENIFVIDDKLKEICEIKNVKYIRIRNLIDETYLIDGLHPNSEGHLKISKFILSEIFKQ